MPRDSLFLKESKIEFIAIDSFTASKGPILLGTKESSLRKNGFCDIRNNSERSRARTGQLGVHLVELL